MPHISDKQLHALSESLNKVLKDNADLMNRVIALETQNVMRMQDAEQLRQAIYSRMVNNRPRSTEH